MKKILGTWIVLTCLGILLPNGFEDRTARADEPVGSAPQPIRGGRGVSAEEMYGTVAILSEPALRLGCSGDLTAPAVVVTAAHCVKREWIFEDEQGRRLRS